MAGYAELADEDHTERHTEPVRDDSANRYTTARESKHDLRRSRFERALAWREPSPELIGQKPPRVRTVGVAGQLPCTSIALR